MKQKMVILLKRVLIVLIIIMCFFLWRYIFYASPSYDDDYLENPNTTINENYKYILYWTPMFDRDDWYFGFGNKIFQKCEYKNCFTTKYKNYVPIEEFSAILFHGYQYNSRRFGKPSKRTTNQIYIYDNLETPINTPISTKEFNNFFNWTMSYRLDADVFRPYGYFRNDSTNYQLPTIETIKKRKKLIAWFVSHCDTFSNRELLCAKLNKHVPIDTFGRCGKFTCPRSNTSGCYSMLESDYKFYLSFENSICKDYITEKLYEILRYDVVPIVYGGVNYTEFTPPNSVIDVTNFNSIKELADYIKYLDDNPSEYLKYFEWKKHYVAIRTNNAICDLCKKLNQPIETKIYQNLPEWWEGKNKEICKTGNNLPKILQTN